MTKGDIIFMTANFVLINIMIVIFNSQSDEKSNKIIKNQETIIQNDSITNERITKFNRANSTELVQMERCDYCETVREHIRKTHTPNHMTCKDFRANFEN